MTAYRLEVTRRAEADADAIFDWIAQRSQEGAAKWHFAMLSALHSLTETPFSHSIAPEDELLAREIRQAVFKTRRGHPYRALFTVSEDTVHVLAIRGAGQDIATPDDLGTPN
jgi:plasmid stabilization system protein ParE